MHRRDGSVVALLVERDLRREFHPHPLDGEASLTGMSDSAMRKQPAWAAPVSSTEAPGCSRSGPAIAFAAGERLGEVGG